MAGWRARSDYDDRVDFPRAPFLLMVLFVAGLLILDRPSDRFPFLAALRAVFDDVAAPVFEIAAQPFAAIEDLSPWFKRQSDLAAENEALRQALAEQRAWRELAFSYADRARLYEQVLSIEAPRMGERIAAFSVSERSGPFTRARLIRVEAQERISRGDPVLNVYGYVGRIETVGRRSARVLLPTDYLSRVPVMVNRSNARALMVGDNSDFPRLEYLGREPDIAPGDRLVTSGDDNALPRGLPVGEAVRDRQGAWRVSLYSNAAPTDLVWVHPFEPIPQPEGDPRPLERLEADGAPAADADEGLDAPAPLEAALAPDGAAEEAGPASAPRGAETPVAGIDPPGGDESGEGAPIDTASAAPDANGERDLAQPPIDAGADLGPGPDGSDTPPAQIFTIVPGQASPFGTAEPADELEPEAEAEPAEPEPEPEPSAADDEEAE